MDRSPEVQIESPEIKAIAKEVQSNRISYIKNALGLDQIGTLEESFISFDPIEPKERQ